MPVQGLKATFGHATAWLWGLDIYEAAGGRFLL